MGIERHDTKASITKTASRRPQTPANINFIGGTKMANKYFIKKGNHEGYNFVEVDEDNVSYKIYINELVYVKERHIDDVTAYLYIPRC